MFSARRHGGGAFDRIYRTYKIASSGELKIDCRKAARRAQHRGRCKSIRRILTADRRAFALRMGRAKIRHSTCEHARVRLFYPPILTSQDLSCRSGDPRYEGVSNLRAARLQFGKAGARVGRRRRANPTIFHPSFLIPLILSILSRDFVFLPAYPDTSGLCAPIGESTVLWGIVVRVQKCSSKKNSVSKTDG